MKEARAAIDKDHTDYEPRCNCGHLFELCPQADCTEPALDKDAK